MMMMDHYAPVHEPHQYIRNGQQRAEECSCPNIPLLPGKRLDKREQCSDWGTRPLSGRQKRYAALDARATLLLYQKLAPQACRCFHCDPARNRCFVVHTGQVTTSGLCFCDVQNH